MYQPEKLRKKHQESIAIWTFENSYLRLTFDGDNACILIKFK